MSSLNSRSWSSLSTTVPRSFLGRAWKASQKTSAVACVWGMRDTFKLTWLGLARLRRAARRQPPVELHHVLDHAQPAIAFEREDRLRVELHRLDRQLLVAERHNHAVFGFRGDLQAARKRFAFREQRMVPPNLEALRQSFEHALAAMRDPRRLAVHRIIQH